MPGFERDAPARGPVVRGFTPDGFSVDGKSYRAVLLTPESAAEWDPPALAELQAGHLDALTGMKPAPEFIILGTGSATAFAPRTLVQALEDRGIGLEVMDSRAAARTWGMLRGEDRWIAAAIMPL